MSSKEVRNSKVNDNTLITLAGVIRSHFIKYKMFFTSFDSFIFTEDYEDSVLAARISAAQNILSDEFILKDQAKETAEKNEAQEALENILKVLDFYVQKRFKGNRAVLDTFLLHTVGSKYRNADALIGFTKDTLVKVEKHKTALFEAGLTELLLENIASARKNLDTQRRQQMEMIRTRRLTTLDRIEKINLLWDELSQLQSVARMVFFDNPEIRALFELPKSRKAKQSTTEEEQEEVLEA